MGAALEASEELEDDKPYRHDHNCADDALVEPLVSASDAKDPPVEEKSAELGACQ